MELRSARVFAALVLVVMGLALGACARGRVSLDARPDAGYADGKGRLVVRLGTFGTSAPAPHGSIALAPLPPRDTLAQPVLRLEDAADQPAPFLASLVPGRYALGSHAAGYEARTDTVDVRAG